MAKKKAHPGFKKAQASIARKQGISQERAGAILAAGAREARPPPRVKPDGRMLSPFSSTTGSPFSSTSMLLRM